MLHQLLINEDIAIVFSDEILEEYKLVINRNKFKNIVTAQQISRFITNTVSKIEHAKIKSNLSGSRDVNDNFLLSLSYDANIDYLITRDRDLLVLVKIGSTKIISAGDFLNLISHKTQ